MGRDAIAKVWAGIDLTSSETTWQKILHKLPESIKEDGSLHWDGRVISKAIGIPVERIDVCEDYAGFGYILLHHDWDYGVKALDLLEINKKAQETIPILEKLFKEWGIEEKIGVFIQTDYS